MQGLVSQKGIKQAVACTAVELPRPTSVTMWQAAPQPPPICAQHHAAVLVAPMYCFPPGLWCWQLPHDVGHTGAGAACVCSICAAHPAAVGQWSPGAAAASTGATGRHSPACQQVRSCDLVQSASGVTISCTASACAASSFTAVNCAPHSPCLLLYCRCM